MFAALSLAGGVPGTSNYASTSPGHQHRHSRLRHSRTGRESWFVFCISAPPPPVSQSSCLQPGVQGGVGLSDCLLIAPGSSLGSPLSSSAQDQGWRCCRLLHLPRPQPGSENCWKDGFPRYPTAVCLTSSLPSLSQQVSCLVC